MKHCTDRTDRSWRLATKKFEERELLQFNSSNSWAFGGKGLSAPWQLAGGLCSTMYMKEVLKAGTWHFVNPSCRYTCPRRNVGLAVHFLPVIHQNIIQNSLSRDVWRSIFILFKRWRRRRKQVVTGRTEIVSSTSVNGSRLGECFFFRQASARTHLTECA